MYVNFKKNQPQVALFFIILKNLPSLEIGNCKLEIIFFDILYSLGHTKRGFCVLD